MLVYDRPGLGGEVILGWLRPGSAWLGQVGQGKPG